MYLLCQRFLVESNTQENVFTTIKDNYSKMICHVDVITNVKMLQHNDVALV